MAGAIFPIRAMVAKPDSHSGHSSYWNETAASILSVAVRPPTHRLGQLRDLLICVVTIPHVGVPKRPLGCELPEDVVLIEANRRV